MRRLVGPSSRKLNSKGREMLKNGWTISYDAVQICSRTSGQLDHTFKVHISSEKAVAESSDTQANAVQMNTEEREGTEKVRVQ